MASKTIYEIVEIDTIRCPVDVSLIQKSEDLFFNATDIAKQFGKLPADFLRLESTQEYIAEILRECHYGISHTENLVRVQNGGKYRGTWLHKELAFEFAGWLSPTFRRRLHKWVAARLAEEHERRLKRLEAKTGFLPLTCAIQSAHENPQFYHFKNECDLLNKIVTGMTAKKFRKHHGVDEVREALTSEQVELLTKLQTMNASLIELGFDYDDRKSRLESVAAKYRGEVSA